MKVNKLIFVQWLSMDRIERVQNTKKIQFTRCKLHNHSTIMLPLFGGGLFPWTTLGDFRQIPSSSLKSLSAVRFPGYSRPCCLCWQSISCGLNVQLVVEQVESLQQIDTTPACNRFKGVIVLNTMRAYCTQCASHHCSQCQRAQLMRRDNQLRRPERPDTNTLITPCN